MKPHETNAEKYKRVSCYLRARLLMISPGESLPSLRTMLQECHCGKDILLRAIHEAEKEGLLERRLRSGYYRGVELKKSRVDIAVFADPANHQLEPVGSKLLPSYAFSIVQRLQKLAQEKQYTFVLATDLQDLPDEAETVFAVCVQNSRMIRFLDEKYERLISISGCGSRLWAKPPYAQGTSFGIRYLVFSGHRRIGFLHRAFDESEAPDRHLHEYYKTMARYGLQVSDHYVVACSDTGSIHSGIQKMMSGEKRPTVILTLACWLPTVYQTLEELHLSIPSEISVLGIGSPCAVAELHPHPSLVYDSPEDLADAAWKMRYQYSLEEMTYTPKLRIHPGKSLRRFGGNRRK